MSTEDELELMTRVAQLHYRDGLTRVEIARKLGISRFKIARVLEAAVESGVVTITIRPAGLVDTGLSAALAERFSLREARAVFLPGPDPAVLYDRLGRVTAGLLGTLLSPLDVLGLDGGRTVGHLADHLDALPACDVVQLSGLYGAVQQTGLDIMRRVTEISGGRPYPLYAPMLAPDAPSAEALRRQPVARATLEHCAQVSVAVVSVGSWAPPVSQVYDDMSVQERSELLTDGVVAETCALMFDRDGRRVTRLDDRRIGIPPEALDAIPTVIAVAGGIRKVNAIRALLAAGVPDMLVTDTATAQALLAPNPRTTARPPTVGSTG